ncbi:hypothetical protein [Actinocrispum sp. NPDC049592]|uniref:hypothetical protein n=1 Tax=Actinocrispum sp. NPDC049592 TaxID=3154835 RepID=UPI00342174B9
MKLFGRSTRRSLILDHCYKDEILDAALAEARDGHVGASMTVLRECRHDPETRMLRADRLGTCLFGYGDQIAKLGHDRRDPELLLVAGASYIEEAWRIRGIGPASTMSHQQKLKFGATLQLALSPLMTASELLPDDAVPWALLQTVSRGLGFTRAEQDSIWTQAVDRAPDLYAAHSARLQALCEKWYGSSEEMLEFAVDTVASARPGSPLTTMLPIAYFELFAAAESRLKPWRLAERMFHDAAGPIAEASRKWRTGAKPHPRSYQAHNMFFAACALAGDREGAAEHLRGMGDRLNPWPWCYLEDDPAEAFHRLSGRYS